MIQGILSVFDVLQQFIVLWMLVFELLFAVEPAASDAIDQDHG